MKLYKITIGSTSFYVACESLKRLGEVYEEFDKIERISKKIMVVSKSDE